jgi:hypothetical protein
MADLRQALHDLLDDLGALKPLVDLNDPEMADFVAAWSVAHARAKAAARAYAANAPSPNEGARASLHAWLADAGALRPFADPNSVDANDFVAAWGVALARAKDAARLYSRG